MGTRGVSFGERDAEIDTAAIAGTPSTSFGTSYVEGSASTLVRTDATLKFPSTLLDSSGGTLALTQASSEHILTGSLSTLNLPNRLTINATATASTGENLAVFQCNPVCETADVGVFQAANFAPIFQPTASGTGDFKAYNCAPSFRGTHNFGTVDGVRITPSFHSLGATVSFTEVDVITANSIFLPYTFSPGDASTFTVTQSIRNVLSQKPTIAFSSLNVNGDAQGFYHQGWGSSFTVTGGKYSFYSEDDDMYVGPNDSKLIFGTNEDVKLYRDGNNGHFVIDPDLITDGKQVWIGASGDDDIIFSAATAGGDFSHQGTGVGFYSTAAVPQATATGSVAGFATGTGTAVTSDSTFTGGSGTRAYTTDDIVLALKNIGILAAS